jgi:hypothetical protein
MTAEVVQGNAWVAAAKRAGFDRVGPVQVVFKGPLMQPEIDLWIEQGKMEGAAEVALRHGIADRKLFDLNPIYRSTIYQFFNYLAWLGREMRHPPTKGALWW